MTDFAVFKDGQRVSSSHSTKEAACIEAFELKLVVMYKRKNVLVDGVDIRRMTEAETSEAIPGIDY